MTNVDQFHRNRLTFATHHGYFVLTEAANLEDPHADLVVQPREGTRGISLWRGRELWFSTEVREVCQGACVARLLHVPIVRGSHAPDCLHMSVLIEDVLSDHREELLAAILRLSPRHARGYAEDALQESACNSLGSVYPTCQAAMKALTQQSVEAARQMHRRHVGRKTQVVRDAADAVVKTASGRPKRTVVGPQVTAAPLADHINDPSMQRGPSSAVEQEFRDDFNSLIRQLSDVDRQILGPLMNSEVSQKSVAAQLGWSVSKYRTEKQRVLDTLRSKLDDHAGAQMLMLVNAPADALHTIVAATRLRDRAVELDPLADQLRELLQWAVADVENLAAVCAVVALIRDKQPVVTTTESCQLAWAVAGTPSQHVACSGMAGILADPIALLAFFLIMHAMPSSPWRCDVG